MKLVIAIHDQQQPYWSFPEDRVAELRAQFPELKIAHVKAKSDFEHEIVDADAVYAYKMTPELFRKAKRLRWIHTPSAGVEHILMPDVVESNVTVTNSRGGSSIIVAEHVLGFMLSLTRKLTDAALYQEKNVWSTRLIWASEPPLEELYNQTLGILGYGGIGKEVAQRAKAFGMQIVALTHRAGRRNEGDAHLLPPSKLPDLLRKSDFVLLSLPLTSATRQIIGASELKLMRKTAFLVNISRGEVVDEAALIEALRNKTIQGAALDVFRTEPLPAESPLWRLPNVIITPHYAGLSVHRWDRMIEILTKNITRFLKGHKLLNIIDKKIGY